MSGVALMASKYASPLFEAVEQLDLAAVRALLALDSVEVDTRDDMLQTALHTVCQQASLEDEGPSGAPAAASPVVAIVDALLEAGADANAQDSRGWAPMHHLAKAGALQALDRLLQEPGVNTNVADSTSMTPVFLMMCHSVHESRRDAYVATLLRMLDLSADFHRKNNNGDSMLHYAALYNNVGATRLLLSDAVGISPNVPNKAGETPLFFAINRKAEAAIKLLLEYDANPLWESNSGEVAYSLAVSRDIDLSLLQEAKAAASAGVKPTWLKRVDSVLQLPANTLPKSSIGSVFKELLLLSEEADTLDVKKAKKGTGQALALEVERLVCKLVESQYGTCNLTADELSWAFLFNKRMIQAMNVISTLQAKNLSTLLEFSLGVNKFQLPEISVELIESMLEYLSTHAQDPDNSLIGLRPEWGLLSEMNIDLIAIALAVNAVGGPEVVFPAEGNDSTAEELSDGHNSSPPRLSSYTGGFPEIRKDALAELMINLRFMDAGAALKQQVDQLSYLLRQEKRMKAIWKDRAIEPYDLVICLTEEQEGYRYAYLRFSGIIMPNNMLSVFTIPGEMMTREVHASQLLPLTSSMLASLGAVKSMSKMVDGPANEMTRVLNLYIRDEQNKFMASKGIDVELLQKLGAVSLTTDLRPLQSQLVRLLDNFEVEFEEFFVQVRMHLVDRYAEMRSNLFAIDTVFHPTRDIELNSVLNIPLEVIVKDRIKRSLESCQALTENVNQLRADLISGGWRQTLTDWWLDLVEKVTNEFLCRLGYSFECVPDDIDEEPSDWEQLNKNMQLLKEILDRKEDKHGVQRLIAVLKSRVYPQIDEFVAMARFMIQDLLGLSSARNSAELRLLMSSRSVQLNPETMSYIVSLGSDLEYLDAVKRLEDAPVQGARARHELNIVPISGLVMGTFYRLENELKTVVEVWTQVHKESSPPQSRSSLSSSSEAGGTWTATAPAKPATWSTADPRKDGPPPRLTRLARGTSDAGIPILSPTRPVERPTPATALAPAPLQESGLKARPVPLPPLPSFTPAPGSVPPTLQRDIDEEYDVAAAPESTFGCKPSKAASKHSTQPMVGAARKGSAPPARVADGASKAPSASAWTRSSPKKEPPE